MIRGESVGLAAEFRFENAYAHPERRRMEQRERRKLDARLLELLQIEGELKKQEKDLATKVCSSGSCLNYNLETDSMLAAYICGLFLSSHARSSQILFRSPTLPFSSPSPAGRLLLDGVTCYLRALS